MHQQSDSYQQEDIWDTLSQLPFNMTAVTTTTSYSPTSWPLTPQMVEIDSSALIPGFDISLDSWLNYDTPQSSRSPEPEDEVYSTLYNPTGGVSPTASASTSGLSAGSGQDDPRRVLSTSAITPRIVTKEDLEQDPRLRDAIQTVSEYRKSRRRAQNRSAQQAFKDRKKRREKELSDQIDVAERKYKTLEAQNKQLKEDLDRKKKERSASEGSSPTKSIDMPRASPRRRKQ